MNINDPFGRVESRHQKAYESLRDSLKKVGLNNPDDAQALLEKLQRRAIKGLAIIVPTTLLLALVLPQLQALFLVSGGLALIWLITTVKNSQRYIKRYIREELDGHSK